MLKYTNWIKFFFLIHAVKLGNSKVLRNQLWSYSPVYYNFLTETYTFLFNLKASLRVDQIAYTRIVSKFN